MAIIKAIDRGASLDYLLKYVTQPQKAEGHLMVGINCDPQNAYDDMMMTKEFFGKVNGRQYKHFVYSFPPNESISPEQILENAQTLIEEAPALNGYQALIVVHEDKKHLHAHIVVNSVHCETGRKIQWSKTDMISLKNQCNALSKAQGLSVPTPGQSVTTWSKAKQQVLSKALFGQCKSYYIAMADAISDCKSRAVNKDDFTSQMAQREIQVNWSDKRKYITFVDSEGHKVRDRNFEKTLKISCSKESLEAQFAKNAENIAYLQRLQDEERSRAKTSRSSLLPSFVQPLKEKLSSWHQKRQDDTAQKALTIAAMTSSDTVKRREITNEIPVDADTARGVPSPRINRKTTEQDCSTDRGHREVTSRDEQIEERAFLNKEQTEYRQHRRYLAKRRRRSKEERDKGMER